MVIQVPKKLLDRIAVENFRIEREEATLLIWWFIESQYPFGDEDDEDGNEEGWTSINDRKHFKKLANNDKTRTNCRNWLEAEGFIAIRKVVCKDGVTRNLRIRWKTSQQYKALGAEDLVSYEIPNRSVIDCLASPETSTDLACQMTRENLAKLKRKEHCVLAPPRDQDKYNPKEYNLAKYNRDLVSIEVLENNLGRVSRGAKVNRVYSPWVCARKHERNIRSMFTLDGEEIVSLDMRAAQPTFVANFAEDDELLTACMEDQLYSGLMSLLGKDRKETKKSFLAYLFGNIRKSTTETPDAFEIQEYMATKFPIAAKYVEQEKTLDYRQFARKLQNYEASIFIDEVFVELTKKNIPVLTVHDSISSTKSKARECREVMEESIRRRIISGKFMIKDE